MAGQSEAWHTDRQRAELVFQAGVGLFMETTTVQRRSELYDEAVQAGRWIEAMRGEVMSAEQLEKDRLRLRRMRRADALYQQMVTGSREVVPGSADAAALWRHCYARMRSDEELAPLEQSTQDSM